MQCSLRTLAFIYVLGGLTFVPLVAVAVLALIYYTSPLKETIATEKAAERAAEKNEERPVTPNSTSGEELRDDDELEGVDAHKVGWLQVSREYDSSIGLIGPEKIPGNNRGKYMDKMRSLLDRQDTLAPNNAGFLKVKAAMYYGVLKHGNLFLYESEDQLDVKHVIVLQNFVTSMWPLYDDDDELFLKPNAICLSRKDAENGSLKPNSTAQSRESREKPKKHHPPENSYFLFPTTNIEKEDWYFALLRGAKAKSGSQKSLSPTDPTVAAVPARFDPRNMFSLIQTIHSTDAQLQTRWLNALIGRIFLATYQTKHIEEVCIRKITKKIARVNRPAFLSDIKVQKVVVGTQAPVFTQPRLKELSAAGEFAADVNVSYNGGFRIEIATVATLQLGSRFKPRQVSLSLAVTVKKLEGKLLLRIKKPPSNRIWVGFYETPIMDLAIEPIVSSRQITYTMVLRAIESRIREAIEESVVLPNMDDSSFLPTKGEFYPGGIWERKNEESESHPSDPAARGDVEGVEKEMEEATDSEPAVKDRPLEHSESADSLEKLEPKRQFRTTMRSPIKEPIKPPSEQILKGRVSRSQSFTSVASAPAVVGADFVNVAGISPSRDDSKRVAEAAARAIVNRQKMNESPKLSTDGTPDLSVSRPVSLKSCSSLDDEPAGNRELDDPVTLSVVAERPESAPPTLETKDDSVATQTRDVPDSPVRRQSSISSEKPAVFASRVSQATDAAKDMLKTRLNTYLAKRQQSKLQKQILSNDRDELVNSIKPRTRRLPSEVSTDLDQKNESEDIDSGPLPFETKKSPLFAPSEFSILSSPGYGPSAMMTIPSTMANARSSNICAENPVGPSSSPALPPRPTSMKRPAPPPLPPRSAPRPIPRRPVPEPPLPPQGADSSVPTSPEVQPRQFENTDDDDLMILHVPSDDEEALDSAGSSIKGISLSPVEAQPERRRVEQEEEAVLEPSSYGSAKSRRPSVAKESVLPQWSEKQAQDTDMPEIMEQGLMG